MRKRTKRIIWFVVLTSLVAVAFVWWKGRSAAPAPKGPEPKIVEVDRGPVRAVVMASGSIAANMEVDVKSKASGIVTTLPFDVSDSVKQGDKVLELDPQDESRRVAQATAAKNAAKARWNNAETTLKIAEETYQIDTRQAEISLEAAKISARDARSKADRVKHLVEEKLESPQTGETAETAALRAENAVDDAKMRIDALRIRPLSIDMNRNEVTLAKTALDNAQRDLEEAEQRLRETTVYAPISGVITTRPAQVGTIVSSGITTVGGGTSVMRISDFSRLFVEASVDEYDIGRVKLDQDVIIKCEAFQDIKFKGRIVRIAPEGQAQTGNTKFPVKIEILGEGKEKLKPKMTADIEIIIADLANVLRVPSEAVGRREDGARFVLVPLEEPATTSASAPAAAVVTPSTAATTPATTSAATMPATAPKPVGRPVVVQVGVDDGAYCEILSGLKEGDKIVIDTSGGGDWSKLKMWDEDF